jgi:trehalose 6-phosphate phosphatase
MQSISSNDIFFEQLEGAGTSALLLDYDGTLAPFTPQRARATPYPSVPQLLDAIARTGRTRLVVISGRAAADVAALLPLGQRPEIWGSHGLERLMPDGAYQVVPIPEEMLRGLVEADSALEEEGLQDLAELKPGCAAVHWRGLAGSASSDLRARLNRVWGPLTARGLVLQEFDGGMELRVPACDKGNAVRTILAELQDEAPVAYLGDDLTDEAAFAALHGRGLTVLVRPEPRPTKATVWLKPPEELTQFLNEWLRACGGEL